MRIFLGTIAALLISGQAFAQGIGATQLLREGGNAVDAYDVNPSRPLITRERLAYVFGGLNVNLGAGSALEPMSIPLGFAYGIIDNLEAGVEAQMYFNRPDPFSFVAAGEPRIWGRYALVPNILAAQASIFIPVGKDGDGLGFRLEAPARYSVTPELIVLGGVSYAGFLGDEYGDFEQLGGTVMYSVMSQFWVAVELGISLFKFDFDTLAVPLGIAAGYEVLPGLAILPGFRFPDVTDPDYRVLQLIAAYTFDLAGGKTAEGETDTPDIPIK